MFSRCKIIVCKLGIVQMELIMGKIAFIFGPFTFYWYGLFLSLSILAGMLVTWVRLKYSNEQREIIPDLVLIGVPAGIISARLFYVLANWHVYQQEPVEIFYIWQGGLDIFGSLMGLIMALYFYTRVSKINFRRWADLLTPGLAAGYVVSRWGNFFTQENFGLPTDAAWGIYIDFGHRPAGYEQYDFFHPVFLYETIAGALSLIVILAILHVSRRYSFVKEGFLFLVLLTLHVVSSLLIGVWQFDFAYAWFAKLAGGAAVLLFYSLCYRASSPRTLEEDIQEE